VKRVQSLPNKRPASGLPRCRSGLNAKARLDGRAFSRFLDFLTTISFIFLYFYFNELSETKMPTSEDLFLACKGFGLFGFAVLILEFGRLQGLTRDFAGIFYDSESRTQSRSDLKQGPGVALARRWIGVGGGSELDQLRLMSRTWME
jgi:hypothetical protein